MVCSNWAVLDLSTVTAVQPSSQSVCRQLPLMVIIGSMVNVIPGAITMFAARSK